MARTMLLAAGALALSALSAEADPTGRYTVAGSMGGNQYTGTADVVRTGQTYAIHWSVAGKDFVGTGIGAQLLQDGIEMGPASENDRGLSIGYVSEQNFGIAMFFEQADGTWQGVWTYGGGEAVGGETWTRN